MADSTAEAQLRILELELELADAGEAQPVQVFGALPETPAEDAPFDTLKFLTDRSQAFGQGASFGFSDEVGAKLDNAYLLFDNSNALQEDVRPPAQRWDEFWNADTDANWQARQDARAAFTEENPGEALLWEIAGGIMIPATGGAKLAVKAEHTMAQVAARSSAIGGVEGALYSYGKADTTEASSDPLIQTIMYGAAGGALGGAVLGTALRSVSHKYQAYKRQKATNTSQKEAHSMITEGESHYAEMRYDNPNATRAELMEGVKLRLGVEGTTKLDDALLVSGRQLDDPTPAQAAFRLEQIRAHRAATTPSKFKEIMNTAGEIGNHYLAPISTRIKAMSHEAFNKVREHDLNVHKDTQRVLGELQGIERINKRRYKHALPEINRLLANNRLPEALKVIDTLGDDALSIAWRKVPQILDEQRQQLNTVITKAGEIPADPNYFPRSVIDVNKLRLSLGAQEQGQLDKALATYAKSINKNVYDLTERQRANVYNRTLRSGGTGGGKGAFGPTKARTIDEVGPNLISQYHDPVSSITKYVTRSIEDVHERRLFNMPMQKGGVSQIDLTESVGNLVQQLDLKPQDQARMIELLKVRFGAGKVGPGKLAQTIKNVGLMTALGAPKSAAIQIADLGHSMFVNGVGNTAETIARGFVEQIGRLGGRQASRLARTKDIGMSNIIQSEFNTMGKTAKALDGLLTVSGFKKIDQFGKETFMNAALLKARKQIANGTTGENAFRQKWEKTFTPGELDDLVLSVRNSDMDSPLVHTVLFHELSDIQPITLSEMPEAYLNATTGRLAYSLKSFALKQLDIMKREIYDNYAKGNIQKGNKQAISYALFVGGSAALTNEMRQWVFSNGADTLNLRPEHIGTEALWQMMGAVPVVNEYSVDKVSKSADPLMLFQGLVPPIGLFGGVAGDLIKTAAGDPPKSIIDSNTGKSIPFIGRWLYDTYGPGYDKKKKESRKERGGR